MQIATLKETLQCTDETPAGYKELVSWCFEYDRHDRPTFEQVATALTGLLKDGPHSSLKRG